MDNDRLITRCGGVILISSRTREHLLAHPEVGELLKEAASMVILPTDGSALRVEVDLGRIVGRSGAVEAPRVGLDDLAIFALRPGRQRYSRVALSVVGREISHLVMIAHTNQELSVYRLITAYVGDLAEREPWDPMIASDEERMRAIEYWTTHALVYQPEWSEPIESTWLEVMKDPPVVHPSGVSG